METFLERENYNLGKLSNGSLGDAWHVSNDLLAVNATMRRNITQLFAFLTQPFDAALQQLL